MHVNDGSTSCNSRSTFLQQRELRNKMTKFAIITTLSGKIFHSERLFLYSWTFRNLHRSSELNLWIFCCVSCNRKNLFSAEKRKVSVLTCVRHTCFLLSQNFVSHHLHLACLHMLCSCICLHTHPLILLESHRIHTNFELVFEILYCNWFSDFVIHSV